jgi:hypothetical protein
MKICGRNWRVNRAAWFILGFLFLINGCATQRALWQGERNAPVTAATLHPWLDRGTAWRSLSSEIKLKISAHDSSFSAKGHLLYLAGESYEIGFVKPYNRILGTFYFTPTQFLYWDVHGFPKVYTARDTVKLSDLIPLGLPNWDPRDLLPFPLSGRSGGFQPDSVWTDHGQTRIMGRTDESIYTLVFDADGKLSEEVALRHGRDPVYKRYQSIRTLKGWPISTKVTCRDAASQILFKWYLSGIQLETAEFQPTTNLSPPSNPDASHAR